MTGARLRRRVAAKGYFSDSVEEAEDLDPDELEDFDREAPEVVLKESDGASPRLKAYFESLIGGCLHEYALAERCRAIGLDPETRVEIPRAEDLAARVEELVGPKGVAQRIREVTLEGKNREECALLVAKEVAAGRFGAVESKEKSLDGAIRTGLAILTEGILVAPLEGIAGVRILKNDDGTDCVAVSFAGPIRAAGGTGQALSVLIADVVRRELQIGRYKPTAAEVDRFKEEIPAYKREQHLQYTPTASEIESIAKGCPVMIDGEATEDEEVSGNRDLPRIETNRLRGGACLVLAEGLILKAPKVQKHVKNLKLDGWDFINDFVNKGKKDAGAEAATGGRPAIEPNPKYMLEITAGRPVLAGPSRIGGWRLRYGRSRTGGLATTSVHPAAMALCDDFLAVGTQMKIERPGKATAVTPCDEIEPPIALLHNGALLEIETAKQARELRHAVKEIVDVGEILVPFGEFAENNKTLPQAAYCVEWWEQEAERAGVPPERRGVPITARAAVELAERARIPLHPRYNLFWHDLTPDDLVALASEVEAKGRLEGDTLVVPNEPGIKDHLVMLGALHDVKDGRVFVRRHGYAVVRGLGLDAPAGSTDGALARVRPVEPRQTDVCDWVSRLSGFRVRERGQFRIGTRMGRPEKAAERKMSPPVHVLFPIENSGGAQRLLRDASKAGSVDVEIGMRRCPKCGEKTPLSACPKCPADAEGRRSHTEPMRSAGPRVDKVRLDVAALDQLARARLGDEGHLPDGVKAVVGLVSKQKTAEPLEKGYLRAKHDVFTFKDGTIRFDMTDVTLTHFKPAEIHTSVEKLRAMGYTHDARGNPLERPDQVCELLPQDIVVSTSCMDYMLKTSRYVDDLLGKFYGFKPYYQCETRDDLVGHLFVGLAPHTSGGVLCRLIGYTPALVGWGHPFFHAAKRRNCDGDEDCVMLLLDGLLNFSRSYLPSNRGGLMDAPLTLTLKLDPSEVDKEAHNVDVMWRYPLEFFEATCRHPQPGEVAKLMETVARRLGKPGQYEGFGYTHGTKDIAEGPAASAYKTVGDMKAKMTAQLDLGAKLRAVDAADVAARVIGAHLLPDIAGNLKSFSRQKMRCTKCNAKYRRIPLSGKCHKCGHAALTMTVYEASVKKYLEVSKEMCVRYGVNEYVRQRIEHIEDSCDSLFSNDRVKKAKLTDFL